MPQDFASESVAVFLTIMAVILVSPLITERIHLSSIIGMIIGGILVGPHGLNLLKTSQTIGVFSSVGLIYLIVPLIHWSPIRFSAS